MNLEEVLQLNSKLDYVTVKQEVEDEVEQDPTLISTQYPIESIKHEIENNEDESAWEESHSQNVRVKNEFNSNYLEFVIKKEQSQQQRADTNSNRLQNTDNDIIIKDEIDTHQKGLEQDFLLQDISTTSHRPKDQFDTQYLESTIDADSDTSEYTDIENDITIKDEIEALAQRDLQEDSLLREIPTTTPRQYKCNLCNQSFSVKYTLLRHQKVHTGEKSYSCKICAQSFTQKCYLKIHHRLHTGEKPYSCNVCSKSFNQKSDLKKHQITLTREKPYTCEVCSQVFTQKSNLTSHQIIHTGERPHSCEVCNRSFYVASALIEHKRIHSGVKPYSCKFCECSFISKSKLTKHQRMHTGERPYSCELCISTFRYRSNLTRHQRKHTGGKLAEAALKPAVS